MSLNMFQIPADKVGGYLAYNLYSPDHESKPFSPTNYLYKEYITAKQLAELAVEKNIEITVTPNETTDTNFGFLAWCDSCQDGLNGNPEEANYWVLRHAKLKHELSV